MQLIEDWKAIVRKAWSLKLNGLALLLGAAEAYVNLMKPDGIPPLLFASLSGLATTAAMVARVMAQKELTGGTDK